MWSKAEGALVTITGKKASEPGHPTLQSEAIQHDNGNHETIHLKKSGAVNVWNVLIIPISHIKAIK